MSEHHGKVHWIELATNEVDKSVAYYKAICGWDFETVDMGEGPYHVGSLDGAPIAGIFQKPEEDDLPVSWMTYLAVSDLDAALADTKKHGGKIIRETFEVPGVGRMAVVSDPGGAVLSLMTPSD